MIKKLYVIVACQEHDYGIARKNKIPWKSRLDLEFFKTVTTDSKKKNAIIMGRCTFEALEKPLKNRLNCVLTTNASKYTDSKDIQYFSDIKTCLESVSLNPFIDKIFIAGGQDIYDIILKEYNDYIDSIYITLISSRHSCDKYFNYGVLYNGPFYLSSERYEMDGDLLLKFQHFRRENEGETHYLELVDNILNNGELKDNRTGIPTLSLFGVRMIFDISKTIPFLTTKKLAWKTVLRELLWFVSGSTDSRILTKQGVKIWQGNTTREFLDSRGLYHLPEGDIGAGYSHQWRHFGADYINCETDYTGKGVDQLAEVIKLITTDPTSRRIILSSWNPSAQHLMCLPPCHLLAQWYVTTDKHLDCQLYQRSGDIGLGVPFNIASYSILTYMIAHVTELKPGRFIHIIGDAHIYENHISAMKEQLNREPFTFPRLTFTRKVSSIDDFKESDFKLVEYECHGIIKMEMAV